MKMVPASSIGTPSQAERDVFGFLEAVRFGPKDVALHSLNIAKHEYKRWGEIDFLIACRRGLLVVEVKGGRVACRDGMWEFTDRYGDSNVKKESPAAQAASAFFSLEKNYLKPRFRNELKGVPMGWAVVFRDIPRPRAKELGLSAEQPGEITGYMEDCAGPNSFKRFLEQVFDYWAAHAKGEPAELEDAKLASVTAFLRPNFEKVPPLHAQLTGMDEDLCILTEEQCASMDELQENDRMMVRGGAGTGKTFLAMASARYDAAAGRRVLVVAKNTYLVRHLKGLSLPGGVTVMASGEAAAAGEGPAFDTLIIDEGQDLCEFGDLDRLSRLVAGGWEQGRWRWFGDADNQVLAPEAFDPEAFSYLKQLSFQRRLKDNIRNAPPIVAAIHDVAPVDMGSPRARGVGSDVRLEAAENEAAVLPRLAKLVAQYVSGDQPVRRQDVAVLLGDEGLVDDAIAALAAAGVRAEAMGGRALPGKPRDCVLVARVEDFKGLERPVVVVAGLGKALASGGFSVLAYTAYSRANHTLAIIATPEEVDAIGRSKLARKAAT
jgi:hypothetical protein